MTEYLLHFARRQPVKRVIVHKILPIVDWLLLPVVFCSALLMKMIRRVGVHRMSASRAVFFRLGVFPVRDHYYEPLFNPQQLYHPLDHDRRLPGVDLNEQEQLKILGMFRWADELERMPRVTADQRRYRYHNDNFGPGDAEYLYSLIRLVRPQRIIEIGSGYSTLMARNAIIKNLSEDKTHHCRHVCIEPYEMDWLESLPGVEIVRSVVEQVDRNLFLQLEANDILFIDSSHVVRPQGDVVRLYLEVLPLLKPGVLIHIHDMFTPRDYPESWVANEVRMWNEQYLVEAFLTSNRDFKVIGALNFLKHQYPEEISKPFPVLKEEYARREPSSFWMMKQ